MENTAEATEAAEVESTAKKRAKKVEPERHDRFGIKLDVGSIIVYVGSAGYGGGRRELCAGKIISFTPKMARVVPIISNRNVGVVTPKTGGEAYVTRPFDQISVASAEMQAMFTELNAEEVPTEWLRDIFS